MQNNTLHKNTCWQKNIISKHKKHAERQTQINSSQTRGRIFQTRKIVSWRLRANERSDMFAVINMNEVSHGTLFKEAVTMETLLQEGH